MKFSLIRNASFGIALSLVFSLNSTQAQIGGIGTTGIGGTTGLGGLTGGATGLGGLGGGAQAGGAAPNTKLPGSFGGPGVTGVTIYTKDLTSLNPSTAFSNGSTVSGGSGANPFGANAFSNTTGTGGAIGGLGGIGGGLGGIGGGLGGIGGARVGGLGGIGGLGGLGGTGNTSAQAKKLIRPILVPDIELSGDLDNSATKAANVPQRLKRIPLPKKLQGVTSSVDGGMVVLRGQVATESDKRMVERLVKLEPGIDSVRNEVTVQTNSLERIQARPTR